MKQDKKTLLWWGRFDSNYSRNRILRFLLTEHGYTLKDFKPKSSFFGSFQALFKDFGKVDAVWVPCFRQNDFQAAARFAAKNTIPLIFDPLISAWDKAVFERKKLKQQSRQAALLLKKEQNIFSSADLVLADTALHADFFVDFLNSNKKTTCVVPVGAEEQLFTPQPFNYDSPPEVLFYGSFINLQGPETIVQAAALLPGIHFTLLGSGTLKQKCMAMAQNLNNVTFKDWIAYEDLPARIGKAHLLLGIFGDSPKPGRVIPNKVYQSLACGRAVITRESKAYPDDLVSSKGLYFVPPANPEALANTVKIVLNKGKSLEQEGKNARNIYQQYFSYNVIRKALIHSLQKVGL